MIYYIYTLQDPIDEKIKYIGKTNNLNKRFHSHINNRNAINSKKNKWICKLINENLKPIIEILDVGNKDNINSLEIYWIEQFKAWGFELKNHTNGGDGGWDNIKHTEESKIKMRNNNPNMKSVIMYNKNMIPIKKFKSLKETERETGLKKYSILRSCHKNLKSGGCFFKYEDYNFDEIEDWKKYIIKREYNELFLSKSEHEWRDLIKNCYSYNDIINHISNYNEEVDIKTKIYTIIKKLNININHFTRKN